MPRGTMRWLQDYEKDLPTLAKVKQSRQNRTGGGTRARYSGRGARPTYGPPARERRLPPGYREDAGWPTPPRGTGVTQEPNAPWGYAVQDPLERQWVTDQPSRMPVLRPQVPPGAAVRAAQVQPQTRASGWGSGYYPRSYGGGGGGGWGGSYPVGQVQNLWWDPGLFNWRYGVSY